MARLGRAGGSGRAWSRMILCAVAVAAWSAGWAESTDGLDDYDENFRLLRDGEWGSAKGMARSIHAMKREALALVEGVGWILQQARGLMVIGAIGSLMALLGARLAAGQDRQPWAGRLMGICASTCVLGIAGLVGGYFLGPDGGIDTTDQGEMEVLWDR